MLRRQLVAIVRVVGLGSVIILRVARHVCVVLPGRHPSGSGSDDGKCSLGFVAAGTRYWIRWRHVLPRVYRGWGACSSSLWRRRRRWGIRFIAASGSATARCKEQVGFTVSCSGGPISLRAGKWARILLGGQIHFGHMGIILPRRPDPLQGLPLAGGCLSSKFLATQRDDTRLSSVRPLPLAPEVIATGGWVPTDMTDKGNIVFVQTTLCVRLESSIINSDS